MADPTSERLNPNRALKESRHFFKIILAHTIEEKKLKIPKKFVGKFEHELSNVATLILPNGRIWEVELTKANGNIWFDQGWHEFVAYNSILPGHFVVFRYERNSTFYIIILHNSAYEVEYPSDNEELNNGENDRHSIHKHSEAKEDGSMEEALGEKTPNSDERAIQEAISGNQDASSVQVQAQALKQEFDGKKLKITIQRVNHKQIESGTEEHHMPVQVEEIEIHVSRKLYYNCSTPQQRETAIRAAETIQPKNPCFMIIMRESNFISANMFVPVSFATEYLSEVLDHVKVEHFDGREWFLGVYWMGKTALYLRKGCLDLWRDNDLKDGDVCIFELRDQKAAILKLSIFRAISSN